MNLHYRRAMDTISASPMCKEKILAQGDCYRQKKPFREWATLVAVLTLTCALVITASASASANANVIGTVFHSIAPSIAQLLRQVQLSDTSQGITMEVQSAFVKDGVLTAYILMLDDDDGNQLSQGVDFYGSYRIYTPYRTSEASYSYQSLGYDEESKTYGFLITIQAKDDNGKKLSFEQKKITLSVNQLMLGQNRITPIITPDWSILSDRPAVVKSSIYGWSYVDNYCREVRLSDNTAIVLQPGNCDLPAAKGYTVTALGFLDDGLHIQMRCDELGADDYGSLFLVKPDGKKFSYGNDMCSLTYWNDDGAKYEEFIYNVAPDDLDGCTLEGEFAIGGWLLNGDWEVTFTLDE